MKKILNLLLFTGVLTTLAGQPFTPGTTYFSESNFIIYKAGNLPIILTAPHGGYLEPDTIPDRNCDGCSVIRDAYTKQLSNEVFDAIVAKTGCYPHLIINDLHRKKLDANRDIVEATDGNWQTEPAWYAFHDFIAAARTQALADYGRAVYFDLHGHGHTEQRLELGYLVSDSELRKRDADLNTQYVDSSSIKLLTTDNLAAFSHAEMLRGESAFGSIIDGKGYPAVPSLNDPAPDVGDSYFSGGYNTRRYGSRDSGLVDAIQVECNQDVRFTTSARQAFADSLANAMLEYVGIHYFPGFSQNYCGEAVQLIADTCGITLLENCTNPLKFRADSGGYSVEILDENGGVYKTYPSVKHYYIDQESFPEGNYFIKIQNEQEVSTLICIELFHSE